MILVSFHFGTISWQGAGSKAVDNAPHREQPQPPSSSSSSIKNDLYSRLVVNYKPSPSEGKHNYPAASRERLLVILEPPLYMKYYYSVQDIQNVPCPLLSRCIKLFVWTFSPWKTTVLNVCPYCLCSIICTVIFNQITNLKL